MKKKYLFISNYAKKISNFTLLPARAAQKLGYEVILVANLNDFNDNSKKYGIEVKHIDLHRNPLHPINFKAAIQLDKIIKDNNIDVIHCNTPTGGLLGRVLGYRNKTPKIIYTAHGFHFYKNAPFKNNLIYKNAEKLLSRITDYILTMNEEDYQNALKFKLKKNGMIFKIPGVGIDSNEFISNKFNREQYRNKLGLLSTDVMIVATGDLIKRKNYRTAIRAISKSNNANIKLFICGEGPQKDDLASLIQTLNLDEKVKLLGFRKDIKEILWCADIYLMTSYQEGLPRGVMEAMSAGLPCVVSEIRGNVDVIDDERGGYLHNPNDVDSFANSLNTLSNTPNKRSEMGKYNKLRMKNFDTTTVQKRFDTIFEEIL